MDIGADFRFGRSLRLALRVLFHQGQVEMMNKNIEMIMFVTMLTPQMCEETVMATTCVEHPSLCCMVIICIIIIITTIIIFIWQQLVSSRSASVIWS